MAFYADNAVLLAPNAPMATDRKSIRESWAGLLGPGTAVSWKVSKVEVANSGELGYLYGTYSLSIQDSKGGPPVRDTGKIVEIWKKQADGKWKCIVDTYNSDLPAFRRPNRRSNPHRIFRPDGEVGRSEAMRFIRDCESGSHAGSKADVQPDAPAR